MPRYIYSLKSQGVYPYVENFSKRQADFIILSEQEDKIYDDWIVTLNDARAKGVRPPKQPLFGPDAAAQDYPPAEVVSKEKTSPAAITLAPEIPEPAAIPVPDIEDALEGLLGESNN